MTRKFLRTDGRLVLGALRPEVHARVARIANAYDVSFAEAARMLLDWGLVSYDAVTARNPWCDLVLRLIADGNDQKRHSRARRRVVEAPAQIQQARVLEKASQG